MSTTVSGSNSLSFAIIRDQSLEVWQRVLRMTGDTDTAKSSKLFFPLCFLACFLIFLKKAFSERKEIFPKKGEGTLQLTVRSMTNATFETVGQVRKAIFAFLTTDETMPLPLLSCTSLLSSSSSDGEGFLSVLEKYQRVTSLSLRRASDCVKDNVNSSFKTYLDGFRLDGRKWMQRVNSEIRESKVDDLCRKDLISNRT